MSETQTTKIRTRILRTVAPVEKPTAKATTRTHEEAETKIRLHLMCIAFGAILAVAISFLPAGGLVHIELILPILPNAIQEGLDRILGL